MLTMQIKKITTIIWKCRHFHNHVCLEILNFEVFVGQHEQLLFFPLNWPTTKRCSLTLCQ